MKLEIFSTWSELIINNLTRSDLHSEVTCRVNNNNISASINIMLHLDINCKFIMKIMVVLLICKNATEEKLLFVKISDDLFKMKYFLSSSIVQRQVFDQLFLTWLVNNKFFFWGGGGISLVFQDLLLFKEKYLKLHG